MQIEGTTGVVTGGASGLGEAVVRMLAGQGAQVAVFDLDEERGGALERELKDNGVNIQFHAVDVADAGDIIGRDVRTRIEETLDWVNLRDKAPQYPAELSGGQKKRIGLARAIILEPEILLYDEPTTGLDPISVRTVSDLIVRLRDERGITSVAITHDLLCADIIADQASFLLDGEIIAQGTLDDLRRATHPELRNFFGT